MALIPPSFLNAVVALGELLPNGTTQYNATGFLYGHPTGETDENGRPLYHIFLVTNRHVHQGALGRKTKIQARFNTLLKTSANAYTVDPEDIFWTLHPDPAVDVAVLRINANTLRADTIEYFFFEGDRHVFALEQARSSKVSEGDGVFVLGFPMGLAGEERNYVIVRQGITARIQDWLNGNAQTFLIDAATFPGNSGGPVLLKPELTSIEGTNPNHRCGLIGMVSSFLTYNETAISQQTGRPRIIFEENSGLGVIVPVDLIQETIRIAVEKN